MHRTCQGEAIATLSAIPDLVPASQCAIFGLRGSSGLGALAPPPPILGFRPPAALGSLIFYSSPVFFATTLLVNIPANSEMGTGYPDLI